MVHYTVCLPSPHCLNECWLARLSSLAPWEMSGTCCSHAVRCKVWGPGMRTCLPHRTWWKMHVAGIPAWLLLMWMHETT